MKFFISIFALSSFLLTNKLCAQDLDYTRYIIQKLTSDDMHGRGYVNSGDRIAAGFISGQFDSLGLKAPAGSYFQYFDFSVNTFPGEILLSIDGLELKPAVDFLVHPASKGSSKSAGIVVETRPPGGNLKDKHKGKWLVVDKSEIELKEDKRKMDTWMSNPGNAIGVILLEEDKLTWHVSREVKKYPMLIIMKDAWPENAKTVKVKFRNKFKKKHKVPNVLAFVEGSKFPHKYITYTAHYDHLGRMGPHTIFPGANDNASGVGMLLSLATHFSKPENKPDYSVLFIAFAGEEAGLLGSAYYTNNPLINLKNIHFLINLDLLGTGDEGLMVVNGKIFEEEYEEVVKINDSNEYLPEIRSRGKAANSDHYHFTERGVPSFFFYTLGGIDAYHDIYDIADTLPLTEYSDIYRLLLDFHLWLEHR